MGRTPSSLAVEILLGHKERVADRSPHSHSHSVSQDFPPHIVPDFVQINKMCTAADKTQVQASTADVKAT